MGLGTSEALSSAQIAWKSRHQTTATYGRNATNTFFVVWVPRLTQAVVVRKKTLQNNSG